MENLFNAKTLRKIGVGILPIIFMFVTMFPGNLGNMNCAAAGEDDVAFLIADPNATNSQTQGWTNLDAKTITYSGGAYQDGACTGVGAHGTVECKTEGVSGAISHVLTFKGVSINTNNKPFLKINGSKLSDNDNVEIVLEGENIISTDDANPVITLEDSKLKFSGDGSLILNSRHGGAAIFLNSSDADVEFGATGDIKIYGGGTTPALGVANLSVTKGNVEVESLDEIIAETIMAAGDIIIDGGTLKVIHKSKVNSNGLNFRGKLKVGKNSKLDVTVLKGPGTPIRASGDVTIDGYVRAIGSDASGYGIEAAGAKKITINHGATVEAYGAQKGALELDGFVIDNSGLWSAAVGDSSGQAMALTQIEADALREKLINGQYKYVKMGAAEDASITAGAGEFKEESKDKKDSLPKTGDSTVMILPVLLMVAGAFIVIASNKKTIFDK